jgi:hypothetical protein
LTQISEKLSATMENLLKENKKLVTKKENK